MLDSRRDLFENIFWYPKKIPQIYQLDFLMNQIYEQKSMDFEQKSMDFDGFFVESTQNPLSTERLHRTGSRRPDKTK